jgi:predicted nucleic acid-binding protein
MRDFAPDLPGMKLGEVINQMKPSIFTKPIPRKHTCSDPEDDFLLDLADASKADYLVTGDRKSGLLQMRKVGRASILSTTDFANRLAL